jgi:hypothetical protein
MCAAIPAVEVYSLNFMAVAKNYEWFRVLNLISVFIYDQLPDMLPGIRYTHPPFRISPDCHIFQPVFSIRSKGVSQQKSTYFSGLEYIQPVKSLLSPFFDDMDPLKVPDTPRSLNEIEYLARKRY